MKQVFLSAGSNLGSRYDYLRSARALLGQMAETRVLRCSPYYETQPEGVPNEQPLFLNAVWEIETSLSAADLLKNLQAIEDQLERTRPYENAPRTVDLDILFYGDEMIQDEKLQVPHPRLQERYFVLKPLCDLAPKMRHPQLEKNMSQLMKTWLENQVEDTAQSE